MDNTDTYGVKDLFDIIIKTNKEMVLFGQKYEKDDVVLYLNEAQGMSLQEVVDPRYARGGYNNARHVSWETTKEVAGAIELGVVSKLAYGIMNNTKLKREMALKIISQIDIGTVDDRGYFKLKHIPTNTVKINQVINDTVIRKNLEFSIEGATIKLETPDIEIVASYDFAFNGKKEVVNIGEKDLHGDFMFVSKFYYTDEYDGLQKTGIIEMPKIRIDSSFQILLGRNTNPLISLLRFTALPIGERSNSKTISISYLDEDIDGDF